MAVLLAVWALLPILTTAFSWHGLWYELGFLGANPTLKYESFDQDSPEVNVMRWDPRCEEGYVFLSPRGHSYAEPGPLVYDSQGDLVWIERDFGEIMDLKVQSYRGEDYLTFWAGDDDGTRGTGQYYMLNSSYDVVYIVSAANGLMGDVHEFKLTDEGTALMTIYDICQADLTSVDGPEDGWIYDGLFQEIDIETGELLFEWRASDYYDIDESYFPLGLNKGSSPSAADAYDYFHINSVDKHTNGNYLVSSRYMHTVTCISPSGEILWVLGGKRNTFKDISRDKLATGISWQHDARWHYSDSVVTLLDNGAHEHLNTRDHSRGFMIELNFDDWTADVLHVYDSPGSFSSHSQGNLQVLPRTGNVFIGWGKPSAYTEFSEDGEVLCDFHWGPRVFFWLGWIKSYRAQKFHWVGRPRVPPDVAVDDEAHTAYVSWNGATDVAGWVLQRASNASAADEDFRSILYQPKEGFETQVDLQGEGYFRLVAVDFEGNRMGETRAFEGIWQWDTVHDSGSSSFFVFSERAFQWMLVGTFTAGAVVVAVWRGRKRIEAMCVYCRRRCLRRFDT
ncbi:arylsulfotransferase [Aspergillus ellipticus CBS 707.79]|uniref:Arylsulfotransferase n=1 Tax=Aspergillus ellipticus CBS 707.79 TaxID=1448320 RepID=A0A319D3T0_9EURO|nr:arylsulfotransferase [Aspergillus ellipticus CBS 707.79]